MRWCTIQQMGALWNPLASERRRLWNRSRGAGSRSARDWTVNEASHRRAFSAQWVWVSSNRMGRASGIFPGTLSNPL